MSYIIVAESLENPFCCNINYYHDNNKLELIFTKIILANILYTLKKYELCRHNSMNYAYNFILISCITKHNKGVKICIYYIYIYILRFWLYITST